MYQEVSWLTLLRQALIQERVVFHCLSLSTHLHFSTPLGTITSKEVGKCMKCCLLCFYVSMKSVSSLPCWIPAATSTWSSKSSLLWCPTQPLLFPADSACAVFLMLKFGNSFQTQIHQNKECDEAKIFMWALHWDGVSAELLFDWAHIIFCSHLNATNLLLTSLSGSFPLLLMVSVLFLKVSLYFNWL